LRFSTATRADAAAIADVRVAAAEQLTRDFGHGHWSSITNEAAVLRDLKVSTVLVARDRGKIVATLTLQTKKPWAIDAGYFTACTKPLYLINMAVHPRRQRRGIGRALMTEALRVARERAAGAIRLDAYDADAGAGEFYRRCGYRQAGKKTYRGQPLVYFECMTGVES
jgi:ribosomal protein S18 acetylase RimI-like enzyme